MALYQLLDVRRYVMDESSELVCSFCQKGQSKVEKIIAGPSIFICDECVLISVRRIIEATPPFPQQENLGCSFCGKQIDEVERLVGKNNLFICNDCVHLCVQALMHNTFAEPKVVEL